MKHPFHQTRLYEIHSRIFCSENRTTIDEIPESFWEKPAVSAADEIWFMGIWAMSPGSQKIAQTHPGLRNEFKKARKEVTDNEILSSPYAIYEYKLNPILTTEQGLEKFRSKLNSFGKKLILDFVPNHMALDTPLLLTHPECFLKGDQLDKNHFLHDSNRIFAHGRDPYFDGWTDTVQWDFSKPETLELHKEILLSLAEYCDGVRCDMAMLALPDVFHSTHGKQGISYWDQVIGTVKKKYPNFKFYAEAYWNREYDLQVLGFDGTYDKTLYDRFHQNQGLSVCDHLNADISYQEKSIRFIENHDENRAYAEFGKRSMDLFALLCFLPGILLFYNGQEDGNLIKLPVQLGKRDTEKVHELIQNYYHRIFSILQKRNQNMERRLLNYHLYGEGKILAYFLIYETGSELLLWNPMSYELSGKIEVLPEMNFQNELKDQVSGNSYPVPDKNDLREGLYFKLQSGQAQWFIF